jgi:hypothetical protein
MGSPNGAMSMSVPEELMSQLSATTREDGSIMINHGDAHGHAANQEVIK